jgi:hypothetical protein
MYPLSDKHIRRINHNLREDAVDDGYYDPPQTDASPGTQRSHKSKTPQRPGGTGVRETRLVIGLDFGTTYTGKS